jgi:uncharacterized SAM-binding protein YcdF (DUF218 family)
LKTWIEIVTSPASLVAWGLFLLTALTFWQSRSSLLRSFALALTLLYFLLSMPLTANLALGELEHAARQDETCGPPPAGSIFIVLAGGVESKPAKSTDFAELKQQTLRRLLSATMIALHTPNSRLLLSGGAGGRWREADLMGALAEQMGYPASHILLDRESRTTYQSALNVAKILAHDSVMPRYLVTSADHMPRAYLAFRQSGQHVCALPVDFNAINQPPYEMLTPQLSALAKMTRALHEYIGILFYRWVKFQ